MNIGACGRACEACSNFINGMREVILLKKDLYR